MRTRACNDVFGSMGFEGLLWKLPIHDDPTEEPETRGAKLRKF